MEMTHKLEVLLTKLDTTRNGVITGRVFALCVCVYECVCVYVCVCVCVCMCMCVCVCL